MPERNSEPPKAHSQLIAGMGIPCCGKSSVLKRLGEVHGVHVFLEPEEDKWPEAVHNREVSGYFTAITWFRSARVPQLFEAERLKRSGETVVVDSYYDKLFHYYVGKPGMRWLIPPTDSYFDLITSMARKDGQYLPNADVIVFFELDNGVWRSFLGKRHRKLDENQEFLESFDTQHYFKEACENYCALSGARLVVHQQTVSSVEQAAEELSEQLSAQGVLRTTT